MAKKRDIPNLDRDLISGAFSRETSKKRPIIDAVPPTEPAPDSPKGTPGRNPDFPGQKTKRLTVTISLEAWQSLRVALATSHEGKTQNRVIDEALLNYFGTIEDQIGRK